MIKHEISIGFKRAMLTVIAEAPRKNGYRQWTVRCDCGVVKPMYSQQLYAVRYVSCGCLGKKNRIAANTKHGCRPRSGGTPEYNAHREMLNRCYRLDHVSYRNYGGRGIGVCDRWREPDRGFANFLLDVGQKPAGKYWLDICLSELAEITGIPRHRIQWRLDNGWSIQRIVDAK